MSIDQSKTPATATAPEGQSHDAKEVRSVRATPSPDTEKTSGAGPAIAEHSKDAKAPKGSRQPGAYVKK